VFESELRKGALDLAVLGLLARGESYGYELTQAVIEARPAW
jgi:DNA-binding PadR family transcriptional regulator